MCKRAGCSRPTKAGGYCPADYRAALRRRHRGGALRPTQSDWDLMPDGIMDDVAVSVAANGERLVRLTAAERLAAALQIIRAGGGVRELRTRLGINHTAALALSRACTPHQLAHSQRNSRCAR